MKLFRKIYISLDNIGEDVKKEIQDFGFLKDERNLQTIWYSFRMQFKENPQRNLMQSVFSLELYLLFYRLYQEGYDSTEVEVLMDVPLFIFNDDVYKIENNKCILLDMDNVGFFSVRGPNWGYPIFFLIKQIVESRGGRMMKTNDINRNILWKGKFYAINSLFSRRKDLIGDIIVPYKITTAHYKTFKQFIVKHLSSKIVLKKDSTQLGQGVFMVDLKSTDSIFKQRFEKIMRTQSELGREVYITSFKNFEEEYRVYFTKFDNEPKIFSLKKKTVLTSEEDIFKADNFEYYTNILLKWDYIPRSSWEDTYSELLKLSYDYITLLEYTTGALEFGKTKEGKLVFFEVNSMADPICYEGEDVENMTNFYFDIFTRFLT